MFKLVHGINILGVKRLLLVLTKTSWHSNKTLLNTSQNCRKKSIFDNIKGSVERYLKDNSVMSELVDSDCKTEQNNPVNSNDKGSTAVADEKGNSSKKKRNRNRKKKNNSESNTNPTPNDPSSADFAYNASVDSQNSFPDYLLSADPENISSAKKGNKSSDAHYRNGYTNQDKRESNDTDGKSWRGKSPHKFNKQKGMNDNQGRSPQKFNQRNKLPEINFENYITLEECSAGLKSGELLQGALRINAKNFTDAYIDGNTGERDIYLEGIEKRNRALPGDIIALQLLPKDQWKKAPEKPGVVNDDDSYFAKTGKVVYIIEQKHSRVAAGYLNPYKNHAFGFALLSPVDSRLPRLMIPLNECPPNFTSRPKDFEKTLFVSRISNWSLNMAFGSGKLMRSLGEAGHIEPETEAIILSNDIDNSPFKEDVINCLPDGETWTITKEELMKRKDLRNECIFTIDPATARDLDDALSCTKINEDLYQVGVHIADVSHFIDQGTALDKVARERATSVYLAQQVIPMLPRVLCEKLCSLNPGVERLAYSVIWNLKSNGTVVKEWFGKTVIRSCVKLSYDHAQQMIDSTDEVLPEEYPPVVGNFTLQKIASTVKNLYGISKYLRKRRFDAGSLKIDMPKIAFALDSESGMPNGCRVYEYKHSNEMIEEFMLLANMAVGRKIYQAHPKQAILRLHPPPHPIMMDDLSKLCEDYDIPFDISDSASINKSLHKIIELKPESHEYMYPALTLMCAKPFQNARYFCTGSINDEEVYRHYALNVPIYTHFTSPIRRYPDVLVHRLLTAYLDKSFEVDGEIKELQAIADHCNDKKWAAKKASEQSTLLFFAVYVKECGPLTEKGVVVGILDKAIDVLSLRLGNVHRVYCDQLSLMKHEFTLENLKPRMVLYWQDDSETKKGSLDDRLAALTKQFEQRWQNINENSDGSSIPSEEKGNGSGNTDGAIMQELTIFSPVNIVLSVKQSAPTKILAMIVNPHDTTENPEHGL